MSDYTPTTDEVFEATLYTWVDWKRVYGDEDAARDGFDRWLAQVKAEAQVEALREAATSLNDDFQGIPAWREAYLRGERTDDWMKGSVRTVRSILSVLNARADRIAREAGIATEGNETGEEAVQ